MSAENSQLLLAATMDTKIVQSSVDGHEQCVGDVVDQKSIERRLLMKTDAVVLPLIVLTSTLAFLDKASDRSLKT